MRSRLLIIAAAFCVLLSGAAPVHAATDPKNKGLLITPLRSYEKTNAGDDLVRHFTVANLTDRPLTVTFSVEQFTVNDYSYAFQFRKVQNKWIYLDEDSAIIQPNASRSVSYHIRAPTSAPPGGQYYTLFASANLKEVGLEGTVRVGTLLYLTVNGNVTESSVLQSASAPRLVFTPTIPFTLDIKNTGNTHYFAYISASLDGLFYHSEPNGTSNLLMPSTVRRATGSISSPILPGLYRINYGYKPDVGQAQHRSQYLLFLPPWSIAVFGLLVFALFRLQRLRKTLDSTPTGS